MKKIITKAKEETQKFAEGFAEEILSEKQKSRMSKATIISLTGNLGAGKTTFIQGFAKGLGIKQKIISPTFVILKKFKITKNFSSFALPKSGAAKDKQNPKNSQSATHNSQLNLIHIDAYRLENPEELLNLNWRELIKNPQNIIFVEWADKIKKILPKNSLKINFKFINENKREITIRRTIHFNN